MQHQEYNKEPLRRYLLGDLDEEARIEIEARLLLDHELNHQLLIVEDELIEDHASGSLPPPDRKKFERHYLPSPEAQRKVELNRALQDRANRRTPSPNFPVRLWRGLKSLARPPVLSAAAALLLAIVGFSIYQRVTRGADLGQAIASLNTAYEEERPVEARLSGLDYAPHPITLGGEDKDQLTGPRNLARDRAGKILLGLVEESPGTEAHQWLGRYYLTQKQYNPAIEQFDAALKAVNPRDPRTLALLHSDFSAALLERAKFGPADSPTTAAQSDLNACKTHLDEALRLAGNLPEALFNLGLLFQEQQLWPQAKETWEKYLRADPNSKWRADAERNRQLCETKTLRAVLTKDQVREKFLQAYQAGDDDRAWEVLSQNREATSGRLVWWQLADEFLQASLGNQPDRADFFLRALEYAGKLEMDRGGDHLARTLASTYKSFSKSQITQMVNAHKLVKQAHQFLLSSDFESASQIYRNATYIFARNHVLGERNFTEYWEAYCHKMLNNPKLSLDKLVDLLKLAESNHHLWIQALTLDTIGSIKFETNQFSEGIKYAEQSLAVLTKINDTVGQFDNLFQLANSYKYLHNYEESLNYLRRCLKLAEACYPGQRQMWMSYDLLAQVFSTLSFDNTAVNYQNEAVRLASENSDKAYQKVFSKAHLGIIQGRLKLFPQAIQAMQDSLNETKRIPSMNNRVDHQAYVQLQLAHLYRQNKQFDLALHQYQESLRSYTELKMPIKTYETLKGELQCYFAQTNIPMIEKNFHRVLSLAEKYRIQILQERQRDIFFDTEQSTYDLAIDFYYSIRQESETAFNFSEISRARSLLNLIIKQTNYANNQRLIGASTFEPLSLTDIRNNLPDNTQILQYSVLEDKIIAWVISSDKNINTTYQPVNRSELDRKISDYTKLITHSSPNDTQEIAQKAKDLYGILLSPVETLLDKHKQICIVPDKALHYLPFSSLISPVSGRPILSDFQTVYAPSSSVYVLCSKAAEHQNTNQNETLLAVGNPTFDRNKYKLPYLPWAKKEVTAIAGLYTPSHLLIEKEATKNAVYDKAPASNVIHFAAHNVADQRSPTFSKLLLAQNNGTADSSERNDDALLGTEINPQRFLRTRLVVLSACRSGIGRYYNGEGMIGMARNFLAANIPLVVASLWSVETSATSNLMIRFHENRKLKGLPTAEALRQAQLEMINHPNPEFHHPAYWAGFILIGGYANY